LVPGVPEWRVVEYLMGSPGADNPEAGLGTLNHNKLTTVWANILANQIPSRRHLVGGGLFEPNIGLSCLHSVISFKHFSRSSA
jgi:hypothetical protein